MDTPNYVLKANEGILVPKNEDSVYAKLKIPVWIIVGVIILGSLIFQDNLLSELSWTARILLIMLVIGVGLKGGGSKRVPSPFEIQFYDEYLIVYREKHYYSKKLTRKEYDKFFYKDIHKIEYRTVVKKIVILGVVEHTNYNYNKDGSIPVKPAHHITCDSICYFYTTEEPNINFVKEIEDHSQIKVELVDC